MSPRLASLRPICVSSVFTENRTDTNYLQIALVPGVASPEIGMPARCEANPEFSQRKLRPQADIIA